MYVRFICRLINILLKLFPHYRMLNNVMLIYAFDCYFPFNFSRFLFGVL